MYSKVFKEQLLSKRFQYNFITNMENWYTIALILNCNTTMCIAFYKTKYNSDISKDKNSFKI